MYVSTLSCMVGLFPVSRSTLSCMVGLFLMSRSTRSRGWKNYRSSTYCLELCVWLWPHSPLKSYSAYIVNGKLVNIFAASSSVPVNTLSTSGLALISAPWMDKTVALAEWPCNPTIPSTDISCKLRWSVPVCPLGFVPVDLCSCSLTGLCSLPFALSSCWNSAGFVVLPC